MKPRFYIESPRPNEDAYIRLHLRVPGDKKPLRPYIPSAVRINPDHWDQKKQEANSKHPNQRYINRFLARIAQQVDTAWWQLLDSNSLNRWELTKSLDKILNKRDHEIFEMLDLVIDEKRKDKALKNDNPKNSLARKYKNVRDKIHEYDPNLTFNGVDMDFLKRWVSWLYTDYELHPNTVHRYIKYLKTFMRECQDRGYHKNEIYKRRDFKVDKVKVVYPYLSIPELDRIYETQTNDSVLENTKWELLKGAYAGQRHSDWHKISDASYEEIDGKSYYRISQKKGQKSGVYIYAFDKLKEVIQQKSKPMTNQSFNRNVKTLCKKAGIDSTFVKTEYSGNKMKDISYKKYQQISSHTARRSFANNCLLKGVPIQIIMRGGGWQSYSSFKSYVQLSSIDGLDQIDGVF